MSKKHRAGTSRARLKRSASAPTGRGQGKVSAGAARARRKSEARKQKSSGRRAKATLEERREIAVRVMQTLAREFPGATTALSHEDPFQLLIATILSAQCTDERVNKVTPGLFRKYPDARAFAVASQTELETDIHSTGFFRSKAKNIIACSRAVVERHGGQVPAAMEALVELPGVGRKTANVVLAHSFGIVSGIVVDTHVHRIARRLGWTQAQQAEKVEQDLMELFPQEYWVPVGSVLILHGRRTCAARKPLCEACPVSDLCPSAFVPHAEQR